MYASVDMVSLTWINRYNNYCIMASVTLLAYDYILTLPHEARYIWKSRWNLGKVLFLLTRYLPFIETVVIFIHQFAPGLSPQQCGAAYNYSAWMITIGMTVTELLLTIRTWAVWEKDSRMTVMLSTLFVSFCATEWITMGLFLKPLRHIVSPPPLLDVCIALNTNQLLSVNWVVLMVYDALIFALIAIQAWRTFRSCGDRVPLTRIIYQDGIIYFAYIFCLSLLNVIVILKFPREYVNLLSLLERVVHSVLTCRIILHIRHLHSKSTEVPELDEINLKDLMTV